MEEFLVDLCTFPFKAEVWGTFSDWVMILVTILTAIYLIKSFNAQREANRISENTSRREAMPIFSVKTNLNGFGQFPTDTTLRLTRDCYSAFNLRIEATEIYFNKTHEQQHFKEEDSYPLKISEYIWKKLHHNKETRCICTLHFYDIDGRKYKQEIFLLGTDTKKELADRFEIGNPVFLKP